VTVLADTRVCVCVFFALAFEDEIDDDNDGDDDDELLLFKRSLIFPLSFARCSTTST